MAIADFHGLLLLLLATIVIVGVMRLIRRRGVAPHRAVVAIPVGFAFFVIPVLQTHACGEGVGILQSLLPAAWAVLLILSAKHLAVSVSLAVPLFLLATFLTTQFVDIVHDHDTNSGRTYTGNPSWRKSIHRALEPGEGEELKFELQRSNALPSDNLPAGWLVERIPAAAPHDLSEPVIHELRMVWHTWLTGLWLDEQRPAAYWLPAGRPTDTLPKIETRLRAR